MNKQVKIGGKKIFYRVYGTGKPVMLVHGFAETGDVWINQLEQPLQTRPGEGLTKDSLSNKYKLIVPDLPGSGQSEMVEDMSIEGMAEILKGILETESLKEIAMIGHSMGGYIALGFAEQYESSLSSFGLFHSTAYADSGEKKTTRRKGIEFIKEHGADEFLKTAIPNLFSTKTKDERPELVSQFLQSLNGFSADALISYYESMIKRPDRVHVLKSFNKPILFAMGEGDNIIPLQDALTLCHLPEKAYIHVLRQSGHMGMLEEPDKSNQLLKDFLSEI